MSVVLTVGLRVSQRAALSVARKADSKAGHWVVPTAWTKAEPSADARAGLWAVSTVVCWAARWDVLVAANLAQTWAV